MISKVESSMLLEMVVEEINEITVTKELVERIRSTFVERLRALTDTPFISEASLAFMAIATIKIGFEDEFGNSAQQMWVFDPTLQNPRYLISYE